MNKYEFKAKLQLTIEARILELIQQKKDKAYLTYEDTMFITHTIRNIFVSALGVVPKDIELACLRSNSIMAPNKVERAKLIKKAQALAGCGLGMTMVLSAFTGTVRLNTELDSTAAYFIDSSIFIPICIAVSGAIILVIATYFLCSNDNERRVEKYKTTLEQSLNKAVDAIWNEYKELLSNIKIFENRKNV